VHAHPHPREVSQPPNIFGTTSAVPGKCNVAPLTAGVRDLASMLDNWRAVGWGVANAGHAKQGSTHNIAG
jgi:hypothetical protein